MPDPPAKPTVGGGATPFDPRTVPAPLRLPRTFPPPSVELTAAGGGVTLGVRDGREPPFALVLFTDGGGGATACDGPKILPIKLPINDPLGCGGGATTDLPGSGTVPDDKRRMSEPISVDGGGATSAGAGKLTFAACVLTRSGAETGGGATAGFIVCTGADDSCRLTLAGAGGATFACIAGAARKGSRLVIVVGGGATVGSRLGAAMG